MKNKPLKIHPKLLYFLLGIVVVVSAMLTVVVVRHRHGAYPGRVFINDQTFHVEIADTETKQSVGLMFRKELPERCGMLFIFTEPAIRHFWMRNTYIPLDIIFIDDQRRIINIRTMPPLTDETCASERPALYVLELQAGSAKQYNLQPTLPVKIELPERP